MLGRLLFVGVVAILNCSTACGAKGVVAVAGSGSLELDRFGGWTAKKFEATGFFRTEHDGKRWWLVTPEGSAFISFGVNHYHDNFWTQKYNRDHWVKAWGATKPWDKVWREGFRAAALSDCRRLGLNTLGYHCETPILVDHPPGSEMPYIRHFMPIQLALYLPLKPAAFADVFAPAFEERCERLARSKIAPYAADPMLLGYAMIDVPLLTDRDTKLAGGTTWPRRLRNLGADAPGKRAYVSTMRERYTGIGAFNTAYGTKFSSWNALSRAERWRPKTDFDNAAELADNMEFLRHCVDRYYAVAKAAIRRHDPNHMFFGDKLNGNSDSIENVLEVTSRYTDVLNVQCYGRWEYQKGRLERWSRMANLPILNGDSAYSVVTEAMPDPHGPHARDQAERAAWTVEFAENAFARPEFVGWHMCGIIDTEKTMPGKEKKQHAGLMTVKGEFYHEMERAVRTISERLYMIATGE